VAFRKPKPPTLDQLREEYERLWHTGTVRTSFKARAAQVVKDEILPNKKRYQAIEELTHVPWWWIACTHQMESGGNFRCHLHCGDPLTARTVHVPAGRPKKGSPIFTFEESACDALIMKGLHLVTDWSIASALYHWEGYNGWGVRWYHPTTLTAYLWSGTINYARGKYVEDGKWDSTHVSKQIGTAVLLRALLTADPSIKIAGADDTGDHDPDQGPVVIASPAPPEIEKTTPASFPKANEVQMPLWKQWAIKLGLGGLVGAGASNGVPHSLPTTQQLMDSFDAAKGYAPDVKALWVSGLLGYALAGTVIYLVVGHLVPALFGSRES
jgi:lysozyme family protein